MNEKTLKILCFTAEYNVHEILKEEKSTESCFIFTQNYLTMSEQQLKRSLNLMDTDFRNLTIDTSMIEPRMNNLIIVSLNEIDCIITPNELYLLFIRNTECSRFAQQFIELFEKSEQEEKGNKYQHSFEILALETIFRYSVNCLEEEYKKIALKVNSCIDEKRFKTDIVVQLNFFNEQLIELTTDINRAYQTLKNALDSDYAMLSFANQDIQSKRNNQIAIRIVNSIRNAHIQMIEDEEIEDLIEIYQYQLEGIQLNIQEQKEIIEDKLVEDNLNLNEKSNSLMNFELVQAFLMAGIDTAAVLAALFGMNVAIPEGDNDKMFGIIFMVIIIVFIVLFAGFLFFKIMILDNYEKKQGIE